jgi:hypothetical protein
MLAQAADCNVPHARVGVIGLPLSMSCASEADWQKRVASDNLMWLLPVLDIVLPTASTSVHFPISAGELINSLFGNSIYEVGQPDL